MTSIARIRPASPLDREALIALWVDLVEHHRRLEPDYPATPRLGEALEREIERGLHEPLCRILVAFRDEVPVGFLFAEIERSGPGIAGGGLGWIHELYVSPDSRRRGMGRDLVARALEFFARGESSRISVRVERKNARGLAFWRALDFAEQAVILEKRHD